MSKVNTIKSTNATIEKRTEEVYSMLLKGQSRSVIVQNSTKKWGVKARQVDSYISKATKMVNEEVTKNMVYDYKLAILRLTELYKKAYEDNDFSSCRFILNDLHKIQGLYTTKIHVKMEGEVNVKHDLAKKTPKELKDHIRKLRAANKKRRKELGHT